MNTGLTNRQISLILYAVTVGYGVIDLPKDVASSAGTGGWVTLALLTLLLMFMTYIITTTQYDNPGKTLDEYASDIFGSIITKVIIISYILYFLTIFTMITRMYSEIIKLLFLNKTPVWSTIILFYGVVSLAVIKRLNAIARLVELYVTIAIFGVISTIIFIFSYGEIILE